MVDWSRVRHFRWQEFGCQACMSPAFVYKLDAARELAGIPFDLSSGYRPDDPRSHGRGYAADIRCVTSTARIIIVSSLIQVGFRRIGVYDRHIHVDSDPALPAGVLWLGESR